MHNNRYVYKGKLRFSSHDRLANFIIRDNCKKVLDIGCNWGFIGQALRDKGWTGAITGIDKEKEYNTITNKRMYQKFIQADIEIISKTFHNKYDAIIFADVLEHLIFLT